MKLLNTPIFLILSGLVMSPAVHADTAFHAPAATQENGVAASTTEGEIKKVNKEAGKLTIRHGELKSLDMPPMTMVFLVEDKSMLDQVKPGDKVNFIAERVGGKLTVVQLELVKTP